MRPRYTQPPTISAANGFASLIDSITALRTVTGPSLSNSGAHNSETRVPPPHRADTGTKLAAKLTLKVLRTADELDAGEQRNAARQQHGETAHLHAAILAGGRPRLVPAGERPAARRIVDVIEQAALGHQQRVRLERALCNGNGSGGKRKEFAHGR